MKVWPNRYPIPMIERAKSRALAEGVEPAALLREVLGRALDNPARIMPLPAVPSDSAPSSEGPKGEPGEPCRHPRKARKFLGYGTICTACRSPIR